MRRLRGSLALVASLLLAGECMAHVFWVQPVRYAGAVGEIVQIQLRVGDTFPGELVPRNDEKIHTFVVVGPSGEKPAVGRDADTIAAVFRPTDSGDYVIGYRSKPSRVTLEAAKFEEYLREKGLEKIVEQRRQTGQSDATGTEIYSRSAKAVVRAGDKATDTTAMKDLGFRVEIVPESNPASMSPGKSLVVLVKSEGKPLPNSLVQAQNADHPEARVTARTDDQGRASLLLSKPGIWVIDTVDMFPAPKDSGADWESVWASLSFELPDPAKPGATVQPGKTAVELVPTTAPAASPKRESKP